MVTRILRIIGEPTGPVQRRKPPEPPPFDIPEQVKFEHTWVMAGSGAGKTTLLLHEIVENLKRPDPPAMVILDPKGTVLPQLSRLAAFEDNDRLVIIDPSDVAYPPAMNLFAPGSEKRLRMYSEATRRQVENQTISLFSYIFNSRRQSLTPKQATCFNYLARLMFAIPQANIHTMLDVLTDKPSRDHWQPFVTRLPETARRWFRDEYYEDKAAPYKSTKHELATRIYGLLEKPELDACFSAVERKVDMFELMQQRKTVIVNLPKALLGDEGMELFGRYIIALTLAAAFERISIDRKAWTPAFLIIDEAHEFADEDKIPELLQLAREFRLGVYFVNQDIKSQLKEALTSALAANTSIKCISSLGGMDAGFMAREMNCQIEDVVKATKSGDSARFLCHVRGKTSTPVIRSFRLGAIETEPRMSEEAHQRLIERNRQRVAIGRAAPQAQPRPEPKPAGPAPQQPSTPPPHDPGEPSDTW